MRGINGNVRYIIIAIIAPSYFESLSFNQFFNKKFSLIEYIFFAVHSFCAEINIRNEFADPNPCLYSLINSQEVRCVLLFQYNNDEKRVILNQ